MRRMRLRHLATITNSNVDKVTSNRRSALNQSNPQSSKILCLRHAYRGTNTTPPAPCPGKTLTNQLVADVRAVDLNHRKRAAVSIVPLPEQLDAPTFHDLGEPMLRPLGQFGFVSALTVDLRSVDVENAHGLRPAGQPQPYRISVPDPDFRRLAGQHAKHDLNDNVAVHHHLQSLWNTDRHDPDRSAGLIRIVGSSCEDNSARLVERPTMRGWASPFGPGCRQS